MRRNIKFTLFLLIGTAMIGVAFFANTLGLDSNTGLGRGRLTLLIIGSLVSLGAILNYCFSDKVGQTRRQLQVFIESLPITSQIQSNHDLIYLSKFCRDYFFTLPIALLIIAIYLWVFSASMWGQRPPKKPGYYYELQAQSFRIGKLSLPTKPATKLLELSNPYDPQERDSLSAQSKPPLDFSLYKGEFYLYWGPVPALVINVLRPFYHGQYYDQVSDLELIFGFLCGIFLSEYLLILITWERFFHHLPKRILLISILTGGLVNPSVIMLRGEIYEAAIVAGQFFLVSGFLVALIALDKTPPSRWQLAFAGSLWTLAIGSRNLLVLPIGFLTLMVAYRIYQTHQGSMAGFLTKLIPLGLPLFGGLICLAWYNWARFGSIAQTGFSYALASAYIQKYDGELFSPKYILPNLYNYLFNAFQVHTRFPFITSHGGYISLPEPYSGNHITGLLFSAPFCIFAIGPVAWLVFKRFKKDSSDIVNEHHAQDFFPWLVICLTGSSLAVFAVLQLYFWMAMRFFEDFMPLLILLSLIGFWQGFSMLRAGSIANRLYSTIGIILAIASGLISILLAMSTGFNLQAWTANPLLVSWLVRLLKH